MGSHPYRYSLRREGRIVATGHFVSERRIEAGEEISIGADHGVVVAVEPTLGEREEQLTIDLADQPPADAIAQRAYELSLEKGTGTPEENWLRAERELGS